jgi:hypothetical protein
MDFTGHYKEAVSNILVDLFVEEEESRQTYSVFRG